MRAVPNYNTMGLAKASLEASVRYLAESLGPKGMRVNGISAGPIKTLAASGIKGFGKMLSVVAEASPIRRNVTIDDVGNVAAFLLSDLAGGVTPRSPTWTAASATWSGAWRAAPAWFIASLPKQSLDGELWAGRGRFSHAVSTARSQTPNDVAWREMRFMVFDMPAQSGDFTTRLTALRKLLPITDAPWVVLVPQERATTHAELQALLDKTVKMGGEGLMLHRGSSLYRGERNNDLLKVKPYDDAEARVVGHMTGKGRNSHRLGALVVETPEGKRFKLGSGLTDAERENPPAIGAWVTYRFNGTNASGLPRFARFMRVREDAPPS
jgi:DNA ligase-1